MRFPHGLAIQVKSPTRTRFGVPVPPAGQPLTIEDCAVAPAGSAETWNGQITVLTQPAVYAPYDAQVGSQDVVVIPAGHAVPAGEYDVDGQPTRWKNPLTGREHGTVIRLKNLEDGDDG